MAIQHRLKGHAGCVNSILFTETGNFILTGSDDKHVNIYDTENGNLLAHVPTLHKNNIFFAKDLYGYEQQGRIVTCAADGRVILMTLTHQLQQKVDEFNSATLPVSEVLHRHRGRAHRIALIPNSGDQFYSAGEDGECCFFDIRTSESRSRSNSYIESPSDSTEPVADSRCVMKTTFNNPRGRALPIYAICVNPMKPYELAMCGAYQYCQIFDARKFNNPISYLAPSNLRDSSEHISGLRYDYAGEYLLASYNDDDVYRMHVKSHSLVEPESNINSIPLRSAHSSSVNPPISTGNTSCDDFQLFDEDTIIQGYCNRYSGHRNRKTVKQVNFIGPYSDYVVSGSDCGHVFIWSTEDAKLIRTIQADTDAINCLSSHPSLPLLAVSGIERTGKLLAPIGEYDVESEERYQEVVISNNRDERVGHTSRNTDSSNLFRMMLDAISGDFGDSVLTESQMRSALLRFFVERSLTGQDEEEENDDEVNGLGDGDEDYDEDMYDDDDEGVGSDDEEVDYYLDDDGSYDDDNDDDDNDDDDDDDNDDDDNDNEDNDDDDNDGDDDNNVGGGQDNIYREGEDNIGVHDSVAGGVIEDYRGNSMDGVQSNDSDVEEECGCSESDMTPSSSSLFGDNDVNDGDDDV